MKVCNLALFLILTLLLSACGNNESAPNSAANVASVNAGVDKQAIEGQPFTLSAVIYPDAGVVNWTQTQGPEIEGFPIEDTQEVEITSPVIAVDTEFSFRAEFISEDGQVVYDEVNVMVSNVNADPKAVITIMNEDLPPFSVYDVIKLSAESSSDPDGEVRGYLWQQVDDNGELEFLSSTTQSTVEIEGPFVSEITNYKVQLTVTDNYGATATNLVDILIEPAKDDIAANAGDDSIVEEFTLVTLDATESISSVSEVSCAWLQLSGITVELDDPLACKTSFVAPDVDATEKLLFEVTATDTNNNSKSAQVTITVKPVHLGYLHDTGVVDCYNNNDIIECGDEEFPKQDADTGRDPIEDRLDKSGVGERGFDFTKFDKDGDELPNDAFVYSCVRDNFTGLIWEVKETSTIPQFGNLRGAENYYSFDESLPALASCPSASGCGVTTFIEEVNDATYCGGANWRLPTYMELLGILDYDDLDSARLLPLAFFPYQPNTAELGHRYFWVAEDNAEGGGEVFNWVLDLATGDDSAILKSSPAYVILVRSP